MTNKDNDTFCKKMRQATKEIHTISDTLVNAKLAFGFLDNSVWADGLLVFYEIFQYLECAMIKWKHTEMGLFLHDQLRRTEAFQRDLQFYLGKEWINNYTPRDSVTKYLTHLKKIEDTDPILLIAYIYHLYMGLLSGGIILRKKRQLMQKVWPFQTCQMNGNNITDFGTSNIFQLKQYVRDTMNNIAETLDEDTKNKLIEESKTVFALNNEIIRSVRGTGTVFFKKTIYFIIPVMILLLALIASFKKI